jgi:hypothetical protein
MSWNQALRFLVPLLVLLPGVVNAQANSAAVTPAMCPVELTKFHPSGTFINTGVNVHVKNVANQEIVGLVFNVALGDAAEDWKWLHWDFDDTRPLRDFQWNKPIQPGGTKSLSWEADLGFEHGGGGAFVLVSALFADGSSWHSPEDGAACKLVWFNGNKKSFVKPVDLPIRE